MKREPTQTDTLWPDLPDNGPESLEPGLYLVATPIGNLQDITVRGYRTLAKADVVACEDTRVSGKLLQAYGLKKPLMLYHDHNADTQRPKIIEKILSGESIALISDAGTPLISDPGYKLVKDCAAQGIQIYSLPGANAVLTALQLSALPTDSFSFLGFLPVKSGARKTALGGWKDVQGSLIIFETAPRLEDSLGDMIDVLGDRPAALTRELTKMFEDVWRGTLSTLLARVQKDGQPKGEIVLVVGGASDEAPSLSDADLDKMLRKVLQSKSVRDAVDDIVATTGLKRKAVYDRALALQKE